MEVLGFFLDVDYEHVVKRLKNDKQRPLLRSKDKNTIINTAMLSQTNKHATTHKHANTHTHTNSN